jgi:hypothetical protein
VEKGNEGREGGRRELHDFSKRMNFHNPPLEDY